MIEFHPFFCQTVNVWCLLNGITVTTQCVFRVIIAHDKKNVGRVFTGG
jgi:hypothetical protein